MQTKWRRVTKKEFEQFLSKYPDRVGHVVTIADPSIGFIWPSPAKREEDRAFGNGAVARVVYNVRMVNKPYRRAVTINGKRRWVMEDDWRIYSNKRWYTAL